MKPLAINPAIAPIANQTSNDHAGMSSSPFVTNM